MPEHPPQADLESLLQALHEAGVDFIVVGGAAVVLHGAPVTTQDVDIVPRVDADNIARLMTLLEELDARTVLAFNPDFELANSVWDLVAMMLAFIPFALALAFPAFGYLAPVAIAFFAMVAELAWARG